MSIVGPQSFDEGTCGPQTTNHNSRNGRNIVYLRDSPQRPTKVVTNMDLHFKMGSENLLNPNWFAF